MIALTNCAETCLKLQKYSDAFTYCMEYMKLDPRSSKVGEHTYCLVKCIVYYFSTIIIGFFLPGRGSEGNTVQALG